MFQQIRSALRLKGREEGATAVEYGIMVAAIAAVIVAIVIVIGNQVSEGFQETCDALEGVSDAANTDCN